MLEQYHDRARAEEIIRREIVEILLREKADVSNKMDCVKRLAELGLESIMAEHIDFLRSAMLNAEYAHLFRHARFSLEDGSFVSVAEQTAQSNVDGVKSYLAATAIVFFHSSFETVVNLLLEVSLFCDIPRWLELMRSKGFSITVADICDGNLETMLKKKLDDYVVEIKTGGLVKRIEHLCALLNAGFGGQTDVIDYTFDRDRIAAIDALRHEFAHKRRSTYDIDQAQDDVAYLAKTGWHMLNRLADHYRLLTPADGDDVLDGAEENV